MDRHRQLLSGKRRRPGPSSRLLSWPSTNSLTVTGIVKPGPSTVPSTSECTRRGSVCCPTSLLDGCPEPSHEGSTAAPRKAETRCSSLATRPWARPLTALNPSFLSKWESNNVNTKHRHFRRVAAMMPGSRGHRCRLAAWVLGGNTTRAPSTQRTRRTSSVLPGRRQAPWSAAA